ncbi:ABC transporter substrate-binding protein [Candidatus Nitronereus thalassa]|uniref:ABC transporter substrate-binding protein n=1 Tax=Candidatus Nitronereus thalassa TaxID=3020898 RepID=A0ABU3K9Y5_9BACT|nr:ABC transporter substrate-binding protein [Candidatus Nitronereus thalassa]MDT7043172.1 ABC transporter substrate-binding protein [Candidatus Nitronereus thalassa]
MLHSSVVTRLLILIGPTLLIRFAWALGTLCLFLFLSACAEPQTDSLRFGLASAPTNLDPRFATDATSDRVNRLLYERLVDFNDAFEPRPALAEWEQISPRHFRFHLKPDRAPFHDGTPLTAQDVKATYDFILDANNASPHRGTLALIDHIAVQDETTVDFHLNRPDLLFPSFLTLGILPNHLMQKNHPFHSHPIGSGPFSFVTRPDETRLELLRLKDRQLLTFIKVQEPTVRALKLLAGEIDMLQNDVPPELVTYLAKDPQLSIQRHPGTNFSYIGVSLEDPYTKQLLVRQAMAHAIDRESVIRYVLSGAARTAQSLLPPDHWAGALELKQYEYNPEKARSLLAQAGFSSHAPLRLTYKTSSDPFRVRLATILQHQLAQVGIQVDLRSYDWGTFYGDIKAGRFQIYSLSWVGVKTPDIFHYVFHSESIPPNGANRGRFSSHEADRLIDQANHAQDIVDKKQYYQALQGYLSEVLPYVPLWYEDHVFIARREITGFRMANDGNFDGLKDVQRTAPTLSM